MIFLILIKTLFLFIINPSLPKFAKQHLSLSSPSLYSFLTLGKRFQGIQIVGSAKETMTMAKGGDVEEYVDEYDDYKEDVEKTTLMNFY